MVKNSWKFAHTLEPAAVRTQKRLGPGRGAERERDRERERESERERERESPPPFTANAGRPLVANASPPAEYMASLPALESALLDMALPLEFAAPILTPESPSPPLVLFSLSPSLLVPSSSLSPEFPRLASSTPSKCSPVTVPRRSPCHARQCPLPDSTLWCLHLASALLCRLLQ